MRRTVATLVVPFAALALACASPFGGRDAPALPMGARGPSGSASQPADPPAMPAAPVPLSAPVAAAPSAATQPPPPSPECEAARIAREDVRARVASLRLTVGVEEARRFDAATAAQAACMSDEACGRDGEKLLERFNAVKDAEAAMERARAQLSAEEVGLYAADQSVAAACGPE
jgi:hypothetical protein